MHWEDHIQEKVEEEYRRLGVSGSKGIAIQKRVVRELFSQESEEIKQEVLKKVDELNSDIRAKAERDDEPHVLEPEEYQK